MSLLSTIAALLGISAYAAPPSKLPSLGDGQIEQTRSQYGGQLQPLPITRTRWYLKDLETAQHAADAGLLDVAAQLMRSSHGDGVLVGVLSTATDGLVALPKKFRGASEQIAALQVGGAGGDEARSVFDEMCPASELALMARDALELGIAVGEMQPVEGRDFPILVRLDPEFLSYRWAENRWYFRSVTGLLPIVPGDGRWVLHIPGGRNNPWQNGLWRALGGAFIRKTHANLHKDNYEGKLANPARVAVSPQGAPDELEESWFRKVAAWGVNTVFGVKPGYDVKLVESNGRGFDCFLKTIADQDKEYIIAVAGQTVTTDGGAGFQNSDIHKTIRADRIQSIADALAYTVNTQILPAWVVARWGEPGLVNRAIVSWDTTPPKDQTAAASALVQVATAIKSLREALEPSGAQLDVGAILTRFGVPTLAIAAAPANDALEPGAAAPKRLALAEAA